MTDRPLETERLLFAVIQSQDSDNAQSALMELGLSIVRLPSVGGFLGRRNSTLLIGIPSDQQEKTVQILNENCRQRVEYIAVPLESAPLPLPSPTPITIGGATIFAVEVEHFEEI
ncbi:MAG: hypothetical protein HGA86_08350 [Anaerolineaceae bacterium]|nr:hypothetical protein [Anaerolineaceae bacterium]